MRLEGTGSKARRLALLEAGLADPGNRPAIVYCGTRKDTDEVAGDLREAGLSAAPYHAGMDAEERTATQRRFMAGEVEVIVATNAFGMGVDKADVRSVWHMAIPTSVEAYYQEAGRAGRDGLPAKAVLLAMRADLGRLVRFNEQRSPDQEIARERGWQAYRVIKSFIYSDRCRRRQLLDHFSDRTAGAPLGRCCDVCDPDRWLPDPETIAVRRPKRAGGGSAAPEADLSPADAPLFEALKAWRLEAAAGKPAYTVANNRTLSAIAALRPADPAALIEISGVGPGFISKYARKCWRSSPHSRSRAGAASSPSATAQGDPRNDLADDPLRHQRRDVGRADRGRDHLDHLGADQLEPARPAGGRRAAARRWSSRPARACRSRARRRGRGRRCRPRGRPGPPPRPRRRARRPRRCRARGRRA